MTTQEAAAKSMKRSGHTCKQIAAALGITHNQTNYLIYKNTDRARQWRERERLARRPFEGYFIDPRKAVRIYDG